MGLHHAGLGLGRYLLDHLHLGLEGVHLSTGLELGILSFLLILQCLSYLLLSSLTSHLGLIHSRFGHLQHLNDVLEVVNLLKGEVLVYKMMSPNKENGQDRLTWRIES